MRADWISVSADLADHPKVYNLAIELGEPNVEAYLVRIWGLAGRLAGVSRDGTFRGQNAESYLEAASKWRGAPGRLIEALIKTGWLDRSNDGLKIHNWENHSGGRIQKAEQERARKKKWRDGTETSHKTPSETGQRRQKDVLDEIRRDEIRREDLKDPGSPKETGQRRQKDVSSESAHIPDPRFQQTMDLICSSWGQAIGTTYRPTKPDCVALKKLLTYPEATDEEILGRLKSALQDQFAKKQGIAFFVSRWHAWTPAPKKKTPPRTPAEATPDNPYRIKEGDTLEYIHGSH